MTATRIVELSELTIRAAPDTLRRAFDSLNKKTMPKYYEDIQEIKEKKKYACEGIRDDLLECLLKSDCCKKNKKTPRECLRDSAIPDDCTRLRTAFFECRRSMLDMRTRFRGRKDY